MSACRLTISSQVSQQSELIVSLNSFQEFTKTKLRNATQPSDCTIVERLEHLSKDLEDHDTLYVGDVCDK